MAKLTDKEKKKIVAEYVQGGMSYRKLALKYKVSPNLIKSVVTNDKEFAQKCTHKKKENAESVLNHIAQKKDEIIDLFDETTKQLSQKVRSGTADVRELVGLFKTIIDTYASIENTKESGEQITGISVEFEDASEGSNGEA